MDANGAKLLHNFTHPGTEETTVGSTMLRDVDVFVVFDDDEEEVLE